MTSQPTVVVLDHGSGNVRSAVRALERSFRRRHLQYGWRSHASNILSFINYRADLFLVNLLLNLWLVPLYGLMGAAWATLLNRLLNAGVFFVLRDKNLVSVPLAPLATGLLCSAVAWGASYVLPVHPFVKMGVFIAIYAPVALFMMRGSRI